MPHNSGWKGRASGRENRSGTVADGEGKRLIELVKEKNNPANDNNTTRRTGREKELQRSSSVKQD